MHISSTLSGLAVLAFLLPAMASPLEAELLPREPTLHDRTREVAPASEPYQWIEYYTGNFDPNECIILNNGAHLVFSNSTLEKRKGAHTFTAYTSSDCSTGYITSTSGWGCTNSCFSWNSPAASTKLTQDAKGNPYPTADEYIVPYCGGSGAQHHQGIDGTVSCDNAVYYGASSGWQSAHLWFDC